MAKTRSMTRNKNYDDDASSRKGLKMCDNGGVAIWSDLNHDVLYLVMTRLGVIDFVGFSGVCKSWRSLALSNRKRFMASKPPMSMQISNDPNEKEWHCYLEDFEGRKFKTLLLPSCDDWTYIGLTCGYLVFYGEKSHDLWLVNPITRHQLQFPALPCFEEFDEFKAILVFSPSMSGWVLVVFHKYNRSIWFSMVGKGSWSHVSATIPILDLHAFKGKIYALYSDCCLCELRLNSDPNLTLLEIKNYREQHFSHLNFVCSGENLYVLAYKQPDLLCVYELDFGEMKWVLSEDDAFFLSMSMFCAAFKPESWADHLSQYKRYAIFDAADSSVKLKGSFFVTRMWYFPHECLDINLIDE